MHKNIEVTPKILLLTALLILAVWLVVQIRDILELVFMAFIFMSVLKPGADNLEKMHLPRFTAVLLVNTLVIGALVLFGTIVIPPLFAESIPFFNTLPQTLGKFTPLVDVNTLINQVAPIGQNVARVTVGLVSNLFTLVTIFVVAFYFMLGRNHLTGLLSDIVGEGWSRRIVHTVLEVEERMGAWVRGQLILGCIIGLASYVGLLFFGIPYALPLALIAGILELVPIIGPILSAVPAVLVALTMTPDLALAVVALYIAIQLLENNLIVPAVMRQTVGLPPLAVLLALMIGGRLGGIVGIILAVPTLLTIQTIVQEFVSSSTKST